MSSKSQPIPDEDWLFLPVPMALAGPSHGFVHVYSSRWWSVHPEKGLRFYNPQHRGRRTERGLGSPQCNGDLFIMRKLTTPGDVCSYFERVFVPIRLEDWT